MARCYACDEAEIIPLWEHGRTLHARSLGEFAQLYACPSCGHKQFVPEFPVYKLAEVYATSYSTEDERAAYGSQYTHPSAPYLQFAERIGELARLYGLKPGARVHEFGCGAGITVHLLRKMGFDATGSDWSAGAVSFARDNGNAFVTREDMSTVATCEPLDMVLNLHAIEHVPRPIEALRNFAGIMKPEALLYRVMLATTNKGDVVLDPFFGTGTTGAVAKRLGREWIGCERESAYREAALERIELALPLDESALTTMQSPKAAPKVAFGTLVETGWIAAGAQVFDKKRKLVATVRADGSLVAGADNGSIHGLGAKLQGAPSCNGWTFWHIEHEGQMKPLDAIRQLYLLATED